ncbi:MAG: dihydroorotase [Gammaproteobacteria bacterium HGW-Gammaproteobacteria-14]|nr:MAG: dihydroorotase [Gammaproteobacteria bacterium HGW-Gammaproteobacteria-14]
MLISNASLVNEGRITEADVLIRDGRIDSVASTISAPANAVVIDAKGRHLIPGMIDDQVHFREPGLMHKGDIATESRAAVAGGITSYMEMPNVKPATLSREALEEKYQRAAGRSMANYAFYLGASNFNIDEIRALAVGQACGVKVFMGASTGDLLVDQHDALNRIFAECPILIATHCEDTPLIQRNEAAALEKYGNALSADHHPVIRSEEACWLSSSLAVSLAKKHNSKLHVLHLTTARELALFTAGPINGKNITAEACVHHLYFNNTDYPQLGNLIKCNPAIKYPTDQQALLQAVKDDLIDIIATDHAPHTLEEKCQPYWDAPAGLPLVQDALLALIELVKREIFDLPLVVRKTSHAVADRYGMVDRGYIREGYHADLVLVDMNNHTSVTKARVLYKCGWTPFAGRTFGARIDTTMVNGEIVWHNNKILGKPNGKRLEFSAQAFR